MKKYKNPKSPISVYEYDATSITVWYKDGNVYVYSYKSAGNEIVEKMKKLADSGQGLGTYITKYAQKKFEQKLA